LINPSHANCRQVADDFEGTPVDADCYPARRTTPTTEEDANCWNGEADEAEAMGLPVVKAVCPTCDHQKTCYQGGYLGGLIAARGATVALATHARAAYSSLAELADGRPYVSIHENPIDLLRPTCEVGQCDLAAVRCLIGRVLSDPFFLNWLGDDRCHDAEGEVTHDPEKKIHRERLYDATVALAELLDDLTQMLEGAEATTPWQPPQIISLPTGFERCLFWMIRQTGTRLAGSPWRLLLAALSGELHAAVVLVSRRHAPGGGQDNPQTHRCVFGVRQNPVAPDRTVWFNDATLEADRLRMVLGAPVADETPDGRLELQHKALQLPRDVTRRTSPAVFLAQLRAVLCLRPAWRRVGLITHRPLLAALDALEPEFRERVVMSAHFGSGQERSSNAWHEACDGIVVAGTPRVPPDAIARYLVQVGEVAAACEEPEWGEVT
jgi:hypothetical protein